MVRRQRTGNLRFTYKKKELRESKAQTTLYKDEVMRMKELGNKSITEKGQVNEFLAKEREKVSSLRRELEKSIEQRREVEEKNSKMMDDNTRLFEELERANYHLKLLDNMNLQLIGELADIANQDENIKEELDRKAKLSRIVESNKQILSCSDGFASGFTRSSW